MLYMGYKEQFHTWVSKMHFIHGLYRCILYMGFKKSTLFMGFIYGYYILALNMDFMKG